MKHSTTKECNVCGRRYFASGNHPCSNDECTGTMCHIITPLPGKRVSGVLVRDKAYGIPEHILFIEGSPGKGLVLDSDGYWFLPDGIEAAYTWSITEWKAQYGKLPRKGSKQMVILELASGK